MSSSSAAPMSFLVPYKFHVDDREPVLVLDNYGLYAPSLIFWIEVLGVVLLQCLLAAVVSIWSYTGIVQSKSRLRFVFGYLVIIPLWLVLPSALLTAMDVPNKVMNFCLSGIIPTLCIFHTMEAMHGCAPVHATLSPLDYAAYCGSPMMLLWDKQKFVKASPWIVLRHLRNFCLFCTLLGLLKSTIAPSNYQPFYDATGQEWYEPSRLFNLRQLGNNMIHALLFQVYLMAFCEGLLAATTLLTGKRAESVMENPMLEATSPSNFWGKRWNKLVHGVLKRGVYLPARKANLPKAIAVLATFLASSLFHEWLLTSLFYNVAREHTPTYGGSTAFLLWNGLLLTIESLVYDLRLFQWMKVNLPKPCKTLLVVMLALPVAHWFCDPYTLSNFFHQGQVAFPMILPITNTVSS